MRSHRRSVVGLAGVARCICVLVLTGVAVGQEKKDDKEKADAITVDKEKKTITIPCKIAPRKVLNEVYPIEVLATWPAPKGQKAHETVVVYEAKPSDVHKALVSLGLKAGKPARGEDAKAEGPEVQISLELPGPGGVSRRVPIERALVDKKTGKQMPKIKFRFTGSVMKQPDPAKPEMVYGADLTGTLIGIFPVTDETVFQTDLTMKDEPVIKLETNTKLLPAEGTAAKLIIQVP